MKEFKSQICTTREQSEKLLALGLKKETADMWHYKDEYGWRCSPYIEIWDEEAYLEFGTPAWSLHRLLMMYGDNYSFFSLENAYGEFIHAIAIDIEKGTFNKDYLEEEK